MNRKFNQVHAIVYGCYDVVRNVVGSNYTIDLL